MRITRGTLNNFRSYPVAEVELGDGVNVFTGSNAQGKTNLLEAIYLTAVGRSMRTPRDRELIKWGESRARVRVEAEGATGKRKVEIVISDKENKRVAVGGAQVTRLGELMGVINVVLFSPDETAIIKNGPSERRRFADIAICQISRAYFYLLSRYNKTLAQRNKLIKSRADGDTLDVWDAQLARAGAKLIRTRRGFFKRISPLAAAAHEFLTDGKESLTVEYESVDGETENELCEILLDKFRRDRERDLIQGFTHSGPQTDDFTAVVGGVDVRKFGSQGQQRTAALALKLAQLDLMKEETGESPVLLLDDVFSELDPARQKKLIERLSRCQTVITATHIDPTIEDSFSDSTRFVVTKTENETTVIKQNG